MTDTQVPVQTSSLPEQGDPHQVAEVYAAQLMDELFAGVENALDGRDDLPAKPVSMPATAPVEPLPELNFAEGRLAVPLLGDELPGTPIHLPGTLVTTGAADEAAEQVAEATPPKRWKQLWTVNRALLGAASLTVLATLGLWLYQRQQVPDVAPAPVATDVPTVAPHAEFLDYLQRSLEVIAQQVGEASSTSTVVSSPSLPTVTTGNAPLGLPPIGNNVLPTPSNLVTPPNGGGINVIERVYIPYQVTPHTAAVQPTVTPPTPSAVADAPTALPATVHKLVGILELGDRSAALFEIDGTPQRVYLGERIGGSGWSLVSVSNEEAVIRRNGEVRSIYISQQF